MLTCTKYVPIYYIGSYAVALDITGPNLAFYLVPIMMAASVVGRIIPVSPLLRTIKEHFAYIPAEFFRGHDGRN